MKNCPNCKAEILENFEICWNCNFSLKENKIIDFKEESFEGLNKREIDCLRCKIPMVYSGEYKFHEGTRIGALGSLFELFVNRESFDLYLCPKCGKIEFFTTFNKTNK